VIIDMGDMSDTVGVTEARKAAVRALWKKYPALKAVVNGRVYSVAEDYLVVPGPRVVAAARAFARMLHD
jgi:ABC-type Fe3+-hydroxamate transport system substrate-binding protein